MTLGPLERACVVYDDDTAFLRMSVNVILTKAVHVVSMIFISTKLIIIPFFASAVDN